MNELKQIESIFPKFFTFNFFINCRYFYILPKRLCLNRKRLSDARVVLLTKKKHVFAVYFFVKIHKVLKVNI